jgi:hypothetical protein
MKAPLLLVCILVVAGCQFEATWQDTTGQNRPQQDAVSDARNCSEKLGYTSLNKNSTNADFETFKTKMDICMAAKGWKLARAHS